MIERGRSGQKNEMRGLEETVQQRSPTLAKFHQLERTRSALSHSRWAALSSVNRGIAAALGGKIQLLHQSTEDPFCEDTSHCLLQLVFAGVKQSQIYTPKSNLRTSRVGLKSKKFSQKWKWLPLFIHCNVKTLASQPVQLHVRMWTNS